MDIREYRSPRSTGEVTGTGRAISVVHKELELRGVTPEQLKLMRIAAGVLLNELQKRDLTGPPVPPAYAELEPSADDVAQLLEELKVTPRIIDL